MLDAAVGGNTGAGSPQADGEFNVQALLPTPLKRQHCKVTQQDVPSLKKAGQACAVAEPSVGQEFQTLRAALRRIDSLGEEDILHRRAQASRARAYLMSRPNSDSWDRRGRCLASKCPSNWETGRLVQLEEGTRLTWESLSALLDRLKAPDARVMLEDAMLLIEKVSAGFGSPSAVRRLDVPAAGRVLVLGDIHGQLEDFLLIIMKHGLPSSSDNVFLLNGDIVDRGSNAVEVLPCLLAMKLYDPDCIFINRGNHEDFYMNEQYGFREECVESG